MRYAAEVVKVDNGYLVIWKNAPDLKEGQETPLEVFTTYTQMVLRLVERMESEGIRDAVDQKLRAA